MKKKTKIKQEIIDIIASGLDSSGLYYGQENIVLTIYLYKKIKRQKKRKKDESVPQTISNNHVIEALEEMKRQERLRRLGSDKCKLSGIIDFTGNEASIKTVYLRADDFNKLATGVYNPQTGKVDPINNEQTMKSDQTSEETKAFGLKYTITEK